MIARREQKAAQRPVRFVHGAVLGCFVYAAHDERLSRQGKTSGPPRSAGGRTKPSGATAANVGAGRAVRRRSLAVPYVPGGRWRASEPSTILAADYSAARFGVNSSGNPLCPVNFSPSAYISKARFFSAGSTEAILSW